METDKGQSQDILQIPSFTFFISIVLKDFSTMKNTGLHKIFFNREKNYENQETVFEIARNIFCCNMLATQSIRNKDSDSYKDYAIWAEPENETSEKKTDLEERF